MIVNKGSTYWSNRCLPYFISLKAQSQYNQTMIPATLSICSHKMD